MLDTERNIVICGHAKHGKSTFAGRLLVETGTVTPEAVKRNHDAAVSTMPDVTAHRKDYNPYSLLFLKHRTDTFAETSGERDDQSRSVFPVRASVATREGRLNLIDNPGHEKFVDNIVYGIHLADYAILVVDANAGVEAGTEATARVLQAFQTPLLAVCVSKMDTVGFAEDRFTLISEEISEKILAAHLQAVDVPIIPVAPLQGYGFLAGFGPMTWHAGPTVLDVIRSAGPREEAATRMPSRLTVEGPAEVFSPPGAGLVVVGVVESGIINVNDTLQVEPASSEKDDPIKVTVRSLQYARTITQERGSDAKSIPCRSIAAVAVRGVDERVLRRLLRRGGVLGDARNPPTVAEELTANLIFFEPLTIYNDKEFQLLAYGSRVTCRVIDVEDAGKTGLLVFGPRYRGHPGEVVRAQLALEAPFCIETAQSLARMSRFVLRQNNRIVACGVCVDLRVWRREDATLTTEVLHRSA